MRPFIRLLVSVVMVVGVAVPTASARRQSWLPVTQPKTQPKTLPQTKTPGVQVMPTIPNPNPIPFPPVPNPTPGPWPPPGPGPWPPVPWPWPPTPWPDPRPPIRDFDYVVYYTPGNLFGASMSVYGRYETLAQAQYVATYLQSIGYRTWIERVRDFGGRFR